jgi:ubiquinone/menaquinone biosynthesis C-methylase UbiE
LDVVRPFVSPSSRVVDVGCGAGGFLAALAPYCAEVTGMDVAPSFVDLCRRTISELGLSNAQAFLSGDGTIPFQRGRFDVAIMVDTIHHCGDPRQTLGEVRRVLARDGLLLILEPNRLNPALALMCLFDSNERGLLRLGSCRSYRRLLRGEGFAVEQCTYNGLLVGVQAQPLLVLTDMLSGSRAMWLLRWLSPKIFVVARAQD